VLDAPVATARRQGHRLRRRRGVVFDQRPRMRGLDIDHVAMQMETRAILRSYAGSGTGQLASVV